ncbi:hypothetical protein B9Z19DRAFT_1067499 [Tuber borchii]|uniref:Uncharacterized protein n=1 Tax=Tuber borchii TaxID=42251 RepID=A0A2T6ZIN1_TUBBO|nr:hypothetical protein B9Z19DRAFT_1067499 [Tuber borchii]
MALVTAVKSRNPFGARQGKRGAYWEDVLKDLQAEGFFKDKKTPFLKTRTAELLHLHQNAEYLNEENPEKDSEPGGQIRARGRGQISSQNQSRHQQVGFRRLANKKNFSLTENSMSLLAGSLDAISYMKETAESDRSTRTATKRKAADTEHAQGAALREILLRGWVRRREMERILAEASDNGMNQEESGGRIALSSRRVNDWRARKRLSRTVSGEGILSPSDYEEPWSSQESQSLAPRTDASSLLSSTPLRQAVSSPITGSSNIQESHLPSTPVSNLRHSRRQLTPAELSHVFLHSTSSRAERQQESWDEILQCLRSQVTVEKEMIGLLREIKKEILNLRGRMRGHESAGLAD